MKSVIFGKNKIKIIILKKVNLLINMLGEKHLQTLKERNQVSKTSI